MRHWKRFITTLAFCLLALLLPACGVVPLSQATGTATPTVTPALPALPPHRLGGYDASLVVYSQTVKGIEASPHPPLTVAVSCAPGEQMIGGGFVASDVFEYDAIITASYPSGPATWTVSGHSSSSFWLSAYVYCWHSSAALGVQMVRSAGDVECPAGTTLLGGGFQGSGDVSLPNANGWHTEDGQTYALCAAYHLSPLRIATASFNAHSSTHSYYPGGIAMRCPAGSVAIGGGFSGGGDLILVSQAILPDFSGWTLGAGGDGNVTGYAVCVSVAGM